MSTIEYILGIIAIILLFIIDYFIIKYTLLNKYKDKQ